MTTWHSVLDEALEAERRLMSFDTARWLRELRAMAQEDICDIPFRAIAAKGDGVPR